MKSKAINFLFGLMVFTFIGASAAQAATFTAAANGYWATAATWTFTGMDADGIPDADDTVTIPSPRVVTVTGAQSAQNLRACLKSRQSVHLIHRHRVVSRQIIITFGAFALKVC